MNFEIIAQAIGYHFWHAKSDKEAIRLGSDAARDVVKALETAQQPPEADGGDGAAQDKSDNSHLPEPQRQVKRSVRWTLRQR